MRHGVMHQGSYDANVRALAPGRRTFIADGTERELPPWPAEVDGIRFGALDRRRRLFVARMQFDDIDIILHQVVPLDLMRHLGGGRRPGPDVTMMGDEFAERLIDDILASNPGQTNAVALLVNRVNQVRRATREHRG